MNLFWKRLFGGFTPTEKFEAQYGSLAHEYKRYVAIRDSKELAEYNELFQVVKSSQFKEKKKTLKTRKYSDTQEYRDITKFNKLEKMADLQAYYQVLKSGMLKEYLDFKQKPEFVLLGNAEEVKKSPELSRLKEFERSKEYKIYTRFHESYIIKEYEELRARVTTEEFKKENEFWADKNRWDKTKEAETERRFFQLEDSEDMKFFRKQDPKRFALLDKYELVCHEDFVSNSLAQTKLSTGFGYLNPALVGNHSMLNERQANNLGKNVMIGGNRMHIMTKEEKKDAIAWHPQKGFVQKSYDYTADVVNGKEAMSQKYGVFSAKIRFFGSKDVNHAFWLTEGTKTPQINVAINKGDKVEVGLHWANGTQNNYVTTTVKGLKLDQFHVFSVLWNEKEVVWYINDFEVFRTTSFVPGQPMFPVFNSYIPEKNKGGNGDFEIAYVKVYARK